MTIQKSIIILVCVFLTSCQKEIIVDFAVLSNCNIIDTKSGEIIENSDIWIKEDKIVKILGIMNS